MVLDLVGKKITRVEELTLSGDIPYYHITLDNGECLDVMTLADMVRFTFHRWST